LIRTDSLGDTLWTKTYGGVQWDYGYSIEQTFDGGYIIAGFTHSFGAGSADAYLIKTDSLGDTLWTKTYGGADYDEAWSVDQLSDSGYIVAGKTYSFGAGDCDFYLIRTDANGDSIWTRAYGGLDDDRGLSVQAGFESSFIVGGYTNSFGSGLYDIYLVKVDLLGDTIWTRTYGGSEEEYAYFVQNTSDTGYIVVGYSFNGGADICAYKIGIKGNIVWSNIYGGSSTEIGWEVKETSDGGYIIIGSTNSYGAGSADVYLVRINSLGDTLWTKTVGGSLADAGVTVIQTADEGFLIAGYTDSYGSGSNDVYIIKTQPAIGIEEKKDMSHNSRVAHFSIEPNPFTTSITIFTASMGHGAKGMELIVYDSAGRLVRHLKYPMRHAPSTMQVTWDGRDGEGQVLPPGIYFLKLKGQPVGKVVKVR
jgi:hypothetical protein